MINKQIKIIDSLFDSMNQGMLYVNKQRIIQSCNRKAKEFTGIVIDSHASHDAGVISQGDIVIIADNMLGDDDGDLSSAELEMINIKNPDIRQGDMLVAVGVYGNKKFEPQYKHLRRYQTDVELKLNVNYCGFLIESIVDTVNKKVTIKVNNRPYELEYHHSMGNIVVLDGITGKVKFFQARGYSVRDEDLGNLMRGKEFQGKSTEMADVDVTGKHFFDLFDESDLSRSLFNVLDGKEPAEHNKLYEINKRPFICEIIPWTEKNEESPDGAFLVFQDAEHLEKLIDDRNDIIRQAEVGNRANKLDTVIYPEEAFRNYAGNSSKMKAIKYMAYKASQNKFNVIITGESGTGKSLLARGIHNAGNPDAPFVEVNCNAIAPSLFESELFGYVGGAFTGAKSDGKVGFFEAANKGTIFLDEIGELPLDIQVKLLHVLQNKIIYRVGSSKPIKVDVRVIAATNQNLEEMVAQGKFRQDLFYRINVFPIEIPPIRERKEDLYVLINSILKNTCENYGIEPKQISGEALRKLMSHNWPGNVRELENVIERAITLCDSNIVYSEHLSIGKNDSSETLKEMLEKEEARLIEVALINNNGDKQKAMESLDISRAVFYSKLKKYGIDTHRRY